MAMVDKIAEEGYKLQKERIETDARYSSSFKEWALTELKRVFKEKYGYVPESEKDKN